MTRRTTEKMIAKVWATLRTREHRRGRAENLPEECPANARMILEAADEIVQWRLLESAYPEREEKAVGCHKRQHKR